MPKVLVIGGGIGRLTAAHELLNAASKYRYTTSAPSRAESRAPFRCPTAARRDGGIFRASGFRFVPAFYRHLPDSMKRIPFGTTGRGCFDNLTGTTYVEIAPTTRRPSAPRPTSPNPRGTPLVLLKVFDPPTPWECFPGNRILRGTPLAGDDELPATSPA